MNVVCHNCGDPMPPSRFRACETCRAEWRRHGRKPGGPAEQREVLTDLLSRAKAVVAAVDSNHDSKSPPMKFTVPWAKITALRTAVAKAEGVLRNV